MIRSSPDATEAYESTAMIGDLEARGFYIAPIPATVEAGVVERALAVWHGHHATGASNRDAMRAALSVLPSAPAWLSMDSAPKGSGLEIESVNDAAYVSPPAILLLFSLGQQVVAHWDWYYAPGGSGYEGGLAWIEPTSGERLDMYHDAPVGWMPLPSAPVSGAKQEGAE